MLTVKQIWPALSLAVVLTFRGFSWAFPDGRYHSVSFNPDENAAALAVIRTTITRLDPGWYPWGTALFYQVYAVSQSLSRLHVASYDYFHILIVGRAISVACGLGIVTLVYFLGRTLFDDRTGRIAALICSVLPGIAINSHYFKTDIPVTFWIVAAALTAAELVRNATISRVVLLGALVGYATAVKYSAATFVPAGCVAIAISSERRRPVSWLAYFAAIGGGFFIGEPRVILNFGDIVKAMKWVAKLNHAGIPYAAGRPSAWIDFPVNVLPYAVTVPMLCLMASALAWTMFKGGRKVLPVMTFLFFYFLLMSNDNTRMVRYTLPLLPFLAIFLAYGASAARANVVTRPIVMPILYASIVYAFIYSFSYVQMMASVDPRVQSGKWIENNLPRTVPVPVIATHYLNVPDLPYLRFTTQPIDYDTTALASAPSPYFVSSDIMPRAYRESRNSYPAENRFLDYVESHYEVVERFQNSQRFLGVDSRAGKHLAEDWMRSNPEITIYRRRVRPDSADYKKNPASG